MEKKDNLLAKWAEGLLSDEERRQFESENDLSDLSAALDMMDQLEYPDYDVQGALQQLNKARQTKSHKIFSISFLMKIAAAVLLVGGLTYFLLGSQGVKVSTDYAETKDVILPDHSEVKLNHNSTISYDKEHWDKKRQISLTGEAFFKVAKGSVFVVKTPSGLIQVVGTQFNVYQRENVLRVACFEGKVQVFDDAGKFQRVLKPSESVYLVNHKQIRSIFEELGDQPSWVSGKMIVKSKQVSEILDYLAEELNIDIDFNQIDATTKYSGPVYLHDVDKTMSIMSSALSWHVKKNEKKIILTQK